MISTNLKTMKMWKHRRLLLFLVLVTIFSASISVAQTTMGTEFWLMFLDNYSTSQLRIYISSDRNVTGTVNIPASGTTIPFTVNANTNTVVNIPSGAVNQAIQVVASDTISVWAANLLTATSEITVVLPREALGQQYVVMSHDLASIGDDVVGIIAVENGTVVEITQPGSLTPTTITLNRGQTYVIRGAQLTGTIIKSVSTATGECKPIAVFAGNTCGNICTNGSFACCCDHIYEQMFPVETWGKRFYVAPLQTRTYNIVRVAAFYNNTVVTANGVQVATLNAGQYWEGSFTGAVIIETSEPAQVAQYSASQDCDGVPADPFYVIIPPIEQRMQYVVFEAIATGNINSYYVNVIVPTPSVNNTLLNGANIGALFNPFPGDPNYSYAVLTLNTGTYVLENPDGFVATVYGYGSYESYGYLAGSRAKSLIDFDVRALTSDVTCPGDTIMITLEVTGNVDIVQYEWDLGDGTIKVGDTVYHVYATADTYQITLNYVTAMNLCGSLTKSVWIGPKPLVNDLGTDTVCFGDSLVLYVDTTISPPYLWSTGDTSEYVVYYPPSGITRDTITLYYENNCDYVDTLYVDIGILDAIPSITTPLPLCYYDTASINVSVNGSFPAFRISVNGDSIWLSCDTCFSFDAYASDSFDLYISITDAVGCSLSDTLNIPVVKRLIVSIPDTSICVEEDTILIIPSYNFSRSPLMYTWDAEPGIILICDTCDSVLVSAQDSGNVIVKVTDAFSCQYYDTAYINILPRPVFYLYDTPVCYHDSVVLQVPPSYGMPYNRVEIAPSQFVLCDTCAITKVFFPDTPIYVSVFIENKWGCTWRDTMQFDVSYPDFDYIALPEIPLCYGEEGTLGITPTGTWTPYTYQISADGNVIVNCDTCAITSVVGFDSATIEIKVTDALGCVLTDSVFVPVLPELKVAIPDTEVCYGTQYVVLKPNVENAITTLEYLWIVSNTDFECATCDSVSLKPEATSTVIVLIKDSFGCIASDTALFTVLPAPKFYLNDTIICWHDTPQITLNISHYVDYSVVWNSYPQIINCDSCREVSIIPIDNLQLIARTKDVKGCEWSDSMFVYVDYGPYLEILGDTVVYEGTTVNLQLSTDANYYFWTISNRPFAYNENTFSVPSGLLKDSTLIVAYGYDEKGCQIADSVFIRILEVSCDSTLFVPNAFTPNDDGLNDEFRLYSVNPFVKVLKWEVRNQWGELLFSASDVEFDSKGNSLVSWDATYQGRKVFPDVYVYMVLYQCEGKQFLKKGDVSVLY